ncbi:MAG: hypothetical protein ACWA5P_02315 [bacterium]
MKKLLTGITLLGTLSLLNAGVTSVTTIKTLYGYNDYVVVTLSKTHTNPDSCTGGHATDSLYIATNTEAGKRMYAAVLSAQVSGSKVRFGYSSCKNWGSTTIPNAYNITLLK